MATDWSENSCYCCSKDTLHTNQIALHKGDQHTCEKNTRYWRSIGRWSNIGTTSIMQIKPGVSDCAHDQSVYYTLEVIKKDHICRTFKENIKLCTGKSSLRLALAFCVPSKKGSLPRSWKDEKRSHRRPWTWKLLKARCRWLKYRIWYLLSLVRLGWNYSPSWCCRLTSPT